MYAYASALRDAHGKVTYTEKDIDRERLDTVYNATIDGNLLVIGQAGAGKTLYVENLLCNNYIKGENLVWISGQKLTEEKRKCYQDRFNFENIFFYHVKTRSDLDTLISQLNTEQKEWYVRDGRTCILVFDDLLNIADKSNVYTGFLAHCRHSGIKTVNIFQSFCNTGFWDSIKGNCQTMVLFKLGLLSKRVASQISDLIAQAGSSYLPKKHSWIYKLYTNVVLKSGNYTHLLIDLRAGKEMGPQCFRSQTDNKYSQLCYFEDNDHSNYVTYRSVRINESNEFKITSVDNNSLEHNIKINNLNESDNDNECKDRKFQTGYELLDRSRIYSKQAHENGRKRRQRRSRSRSSRSCSQSSRSSRSSCGSSNSSRSWSGERSRRKIRSRNGQKRKQKHYRKISKQPKYRHGSRSNTFFYKRKRRHGRSSDSSIGSSKHSSREQSPLYTRSGYNRVN